MWCVCVCVCVCARACACVCVTFFSLRRQPLTQLPQLTLSNTTVTIPAQFAHTSRHRQATPPSGHATARSRHHQELEQRPSAAK